MWRWRVVVFFDFCVFMGWHIREDFLCTWYLGPTMNFSAAQNVPVWTPIISPREKNLSPSPPQQKRFQAANWFRKGCFTGDMLTHHIVTTRDNHQPEAKTCSRRNRRVPIFSGKLPRLHVRDRLGEVDMRSPRSQKGKKPRLWWHGKHTLDNTKATALGHLESRKCELAGVFCGWLTQFETLMLDDVKQFLLPDVLSQQVPCATTVTRQDGSDGWVATVVSDDDAPTNWKC